MKVNSGVIVCLLKMTGVLHILLFYGLDFARKHLEIINTDQVRAKSCRKLMFFYSLKELVVVLVCC